MKSQHNRILGKTGEDLAAAWLTGHGFRVVVRNFQTPYGELDIIAEKEGQLHVVEVKTRRTTAFGDPLEAISLSKQEHLKRSTQAMALLKIPGVRYPVRSIHIDAISILMDETAAPSIIFVGDILA